MGICVALCALCALALAEQLTRTGCRAAGVGGGVGGRKGLSLGDSSKLTGSLLLAGHRRVGWVPSDTRPLSCNYVLSSTLQNRAHYLMYCSLADDTNFNQMMYICVI